MTRALAIVALLAATAHADKASDAAIASYQRELDACEMRRDGFDMVVKGTRQLLAQAPPDADAVGKDLAKLEAGLATYVDYCGELGAVLALLHDGKSALAPHDAKVKQLRAPAQRLVGQLEPITKRLVPRFDFGPDGKKLKIGVHSLADKKSAKFPSGRTLELPVANGTWKLTGTDKEDTAMYTDKGSRATLWSKPVKASCKDALEQTRAKAAPEELGEVDNADARQLGVAWYVQYARRDGATPHLFQAMCLERGGAGYVVTADLQSPDKPPSAGDKFTLSLDDYAAIMAQMLALRFPAATP